MALLKSLFIIAASALAYLFVFELNSYLFSAFEHSREVNWVFLPSGLRLVLILIFVESGAIGITIASVIIGYHYRIDGNMVTIAGAAFMSGFAPWLARQVCIDKFKLDVNLSNLTPTTLLKISVLFSLVSPVLHQLWFTWRGLTTDFLRSTTIMFVGDLVGTIMLLYAAKFALNLLTPTFKRGAL